MLDEQVNDLVGSPIVGLVETQLTEEVVLSDHVGRRVGHGLHDAGQRGPVEWVVLVVHDVELDTGVLEDLERAP